jgi:hypothetical protein
MVQFLAGARDSSLLHSIKTSSAAHLFSYAMGSRTFFPGITTHLCLVSRSRMAELHLHSPTYLHGTVLNELTTGTTLPFTFIYK